jgi:hypothetical protein
MRRTLLVSVAVLTAGAVFAGTALAVASPSVVTGGTSAVRQTSAALHGTVNPDGRGTAYYFQWGLTTAYGANGPLKAAGRGTKALAVLETAGGLTPGTIYHYRLVAANSAGTSVGADRTFRTAGHPPALVLTTPAAQLSSTGATLTGAVNPEGQATTWYFEWGSLSSLSQQTAPQTLGPATVPEPVSWSLQGLLAPATLYQYRLVGVHTGSATAFANTGVFMTYPAVRPYPRVTVTTTPRHRLRRPYIFQTSGTLGGPSWLPGQYACTGAVAIWFFHGRQAKSTLAAVQPDCTFSALTLFSRLRGRRPVHLRVIVRYLSSPYLAPSIAQVQPVTVG